MKDGKNITYHDGTPKDICKKFDRIIKDNKYYLYLKKNGKEFVNREGDLKKWSILFNKEIEKILLSKKELEISKWKKFIGFFILGLIVFFRKGPLKKIKVSINN